MIRLNQLKLNPGYTDEDIYSAAASKLRIPASDIVYINVIKRSLDARKKENIRYILSVDADVRNQEKILKKSHNNPDISISKNNEYILPQQGSNRLAEAPVVIGAGPAGLFCAYMLALNGYKPILYEQGSTVEERRMDVEKFWAGETELNLYSNVQFGEGGAGTFSDGKLTTGIKDENGRKTFFLKTFIKFGAQKNIIYDAKPHVGTDRLCGIVSSIRREIIKLGGQVIFNACLESIHVNDKKIKWITIRKQDGKFQEVMCDCLVLALGHSSRDTIKMLYNNGLNMVAKPFAVGVRIEHNQENINKAQYGPNYKEVYGNQLPAADYKLTYKAVDGSSVYSFCMCPGGYVVNASSENYRLCVNGMSYSGRDGINANSAIVASVKPEETAPDNSPLSAIEFQRNLEAKAYGTDGSIPIQRLEDFYSNRKTTEIGKVSPQIKGKTRFANLNEILPRKVCDDIKEALNYFNNEINGFGDKDAIISAVESRTSSPVRMIRDEHLESNIKGIYPCGEGAGYAGGIVSAAVDGIKVFEEIYKKYGVNNE